MTTKHGLATMATTAVPAMNGMMMPPEMTMVAAPLPGSIVPNNAHSVNYFDDNRQVFIHSFIWFLNSIL